MSYTFPNLKRIFTASTFRAVMLLFLLLLSALTVLCLMVYERSYSLVQAGIFSSHQSQIEHYLAVLENDIQYIRSQQANLVNDMELNTLGFSYDDMTLSDIVLTERSMQEKMNTLRDSSPYVDDATVWLLTEGISISGKNGVSRLTEDDYTFIQNSVQNPASPISVYQDRPYMVLLSPYLMDIGPEPQKGLNALAIVICLDLESFTRDISRGETEYGTQAVLVFGEYVPPDSPKNVDSYLSGEIGRLAGTDTDGSLSMDYQGEPYIVSYQRSSALDALLFIYTPEENVLSPLHFYRGWLAVFLIVSVVVVALFAGMVYVMLHKPLHTLLAAFRQVESGDLNVAIEHRGPEEFAYIYEGFNRMISTICRLNNEVTEQTILTQQAELKHLQQKINPHFLYNAFFSISTVAMAEGCELASQLAQKLGEYFRYVTKEASENVRLSSEVKYARIYGEIQELRFSNRLSIIIDELPSPELGDLRLPALILQPLIENALEHGLRNTVANGIIHVGFRGQDDWLAVYVEDNGGELTERNLAQIREDCFYPKDTGAAGALSNIYRRLTIRFGREKLLELGRSGLGGLLAEIHIPLSGKE
ncbi:MAG: histidine kinase [Acutalibacter sp.]|nr:histidine kinase [Acutalibacter sp.]